MKRKLFSFAVSWILSQSIYAQTLFSFADNKVDVKEFIRAYNKVYDDGPIADKEKSVREYLSLYINSRLKIHEAYEQGLDTIPAFIEEVKNLRRQVMENYMTDPESYSRLANEAFDRSQKDIQVQHIFIPYKVNGNISDSSVARLKIREAHLELSAGKSFDAVALKYSADPSVPNNKGNLGFVTAFTLPYEFENIVYSLPPGKFSAPYKSKTGYHIFKIISERRAVGKIKAAQILIAIPPGANPQERKKFATLADSLYLRLLKGDDFAKLAGRFSNDYISAASGGLLPEFSVGTYDPVFENTVISLPAAGALSKPFFTSHGYHIVKRISMTPPPAIRTKKALDEIKIQLDKDARINLTRDVLIRHVINNAGFKQAEINLPLLNAYADSLLSFNQAPSENPLKNDMLLVKIGDLEKNIGDLVSYAQANRWLADGGSVAKPFNQLLEEFKQSVVLEYYKIHMEEFNEEFRRQMNELKEGNLFFEIMMKEVWNKAQSDTSGQLNYYNQHIKKYTWNNSAGAILFYCSNEETAKALKESVSQKPLAWKMSLENFSERATVDSGRFEWAKIPGLKNMTPKQGMITAIEKNKDDNSAAFAWIIKVFTKPVQKTFDEAKGDVITDYQEELDKQWVNSLKEKYPVVIDEKTLLSILK